MIKFRFNDKWTFKSAKLQHYNSNMNFLYDHEWILEWSKMLDFRLTVGTGTTNGMQVFHSLICSDETLVTSTCTSNPVLKSHSTYSVENYIVSSSILSALFGEWKSYVWCFFSTLKDLRDLDKKLDLSTPIMTKTEFLLTILFNIKQKSHENKEQCQLNNY